MRFLLALFLSIPAVAFAQQPDGTQLLGQQLGACFTAQAKLFDQVTALNAKIAQLTKENEALKKPAPKGK